MTYPSGDTANQDAWIKTLTVEEQLEFYAADKRQKQLRQNVVDEGKLVFDDTLSQYIWKDKDTFHVNKPSDPVWQIYWDRWLKEENIIFTMTCTEVE
jgi:hypothetical protein